MTGGNPYQSESCRIEQIINQTETEHTFRIRFDKPTQPGQFFEVSLPKFGESPFSISEIGPDYIDMTIRNAQGRVTAAISALNPGDRLYIRGPYGNGFNLDEFKGRPLIVLAGGVGLAPVKPIIDYFASHPDQMPLLQILVGFKSKTEILFRDEIEKWRSGAKLILSLDSGPEAPSWRIGLLPKFIKETSVTLETRAVVVGPPLMIKFTIQALLEHGVSEENIWISQERKMCCGLGHCGHCKISSTYVCVDGPVFNYAASKEMFD
jgi:anaerobic sulfite reductase subunit B